MPVRYVKSRNNKHNTWHRQTWSTRHGDWNFRTTCGQPVGGPGDYDKEALAEGDTLCPACARNIGRYHRPRYR